MDERETRLRKNLEAIQERVQGAVCPIYGSDDQDEPELIGSCVLLSVNHYLFLLTAAHVLDKNKHTTLYLAGRNQLFEVAGPSHRAPAPPGGRHSDRFDFGFILVADTVADELRRFTLVSPGDIDVADPPAPHTLYGFVGYPETKNRPLPDRKLKLSSTVFTVTPADSGRYVPLGLDPLHHFVGDFDREKLVDSEKGMVTGPDPHGMSGGGVWRLGRLDQIESGSHCERLIGIGIEYHKPARALVGVRMSLVVASLATSYPDIAPLLPQPTRVRVNVSIQHAP